MTQDTPLTNEAAIGFARLLVDKDTFTVTELVPADFARSLERKLAAAERDAARLRDALNEIASWGEGPEVNSSFDEPGSAQTARAALSQEG